MKGKARVLLVTLVVLLAMLACGNFNESSPTWDAVQHTVQEAGK